MLRKLKLIFLNKNIMTQLFFTFSCLIFICASFSSLLTLFRNNAIYTIVLLIIMSGLIYGIFYFLKKLNMEKKWVEYLLVGILILIGLLLRVGTNRIIKTQPISDFSTPHDVYKQLHSKNNDIFAIRETYDDLSFYQKYYATYPAWFPYMKVISFIYDTFGVNLRYIKIMNWCLYALTALLIYWICKKIKSKKAGIFGLLLFACYPSLIVYTNITTPDHFSILFFTCFIATWVKMLEYRENNSRYFYIWSIANIFSIVAINLFKPLSILGLLVFICTELLYFIFPIIKNKVKRKQYIQDALGYVVGFVVICFLGIQTSNQILNSQVEKTIHTEVVNSTPLYLLWAYSVDETGNYNPDVATQTYTELQLKYRFNQKKVMEEISVLAKRQIIENISKMPRIFYQKFKIVFASEEDVFAFANYSDNETYEQSLRDHVQKYYTYFANMFMSILFTICALSLIKEMKNKNKNPMTIVIVLTIIGYILVLLLGGVQGRYKMLISALLCILASNIFNESGKEKLKC